MDFLNIPVCLSQYFVNKQNVRSFNNIVKSNILKESDEEFCKFLLEEESLVSDLSADFIKQISIIKHNLKNKCKQDFKEYFPKNEDSYLQPVDKEYIFTKSWLALSEIIPRNIFGCSQNNKIFRNLMQNVVYSMKRQHLMVGKLVEKWNIIILPWRDLPNSKNILYRLVVGISKHILAPIICLNFHVTTCKLDPNENKLHYFWKNQWQSFYDQQISKMVYTKVIKKFEPYSQSKKLRKNHSLVRKVNMKMVKKEIPKLHLTLKPNNDCRPIVCYKNSLQSTSEKYKIKDRLRFLKTLAGKSIKNIENLYNDIFTKWINAMKPKLYFIKTDLSNAFGAINREKLMKILTKKYTNFLRAETCINKKKRIAQQYKDVVTELRKPILIRAGSTVYEWMEGLVQGYKYSPALSEIYYSYLDEIYLSDHLQNTENKINLFIRVVDDYLYITDCIDDALLFLDALDNYRNVNYNKTVVNFPHKNIKFSEEITFLGYSYDTGTMQVSRATNIYAGQMCYKIAFTNGLTDLSKFIQTRIGRSSIQINGHIFNLHYNNENLIWKHIFNTFCLSANKFCTILAVQSVDEMNTYLKIYKKVVTVKLTISMIRTLTKYKPVDFMFMYCINNFRYLSWKALYLCAKLTPRCSGLVPLINDELSKTNCIFGIWRPHASRIDTHGDSIRKAIKEVCRRNDLRAIFKDFTVLPLGFECYHHRRLK